MSDKKVYLKQNVQVEPLINKWYAWIQMIPPTTAAFNVVERHLNTMNSYVHSPFMHAAAVKNPEMRGGPFIDLDGKRVEEVRALMEETQQKASSLIEFVAAVNELRELLQNKAKGYSMEPLYEEVPSILRGYVELYYDINHQPSFRFFESLLYKSPYYCPSFQSIALSEIVEDVSRPFIFTTPRLGDENTVHLDIPFVHPGLDELFKMKRVPQTYDFIIEKLGVEVKNQEVFRSFFTEEAPPAYQKYEGDKFRIRYFGHACILIESQDLNILIDPVLSYTYESDISRFTYLDLPEHIHYVLVTHSHHDHILLETILQLRHNIGNIVIGRNADGLLQDPSLKLLLDNLGFENVKELRDLEEIKFPGGAITGIPFLGEHHDLLVLSKLCYLIRIGEYSLLSVADSCNIEPALYKKVFDIYGPVNVLFLGMECDGAPLSWVYGPLFDGPIDRDKDHSRRGRGCNYQEGIKLVNQFQCEEVYVYAMGEEPWVRYLLDVEYTDESNPILQSEKLLLDCRERGIVAERLFAEKELLVK